MCGVILPHRCVLSPTTARVMHVSLVGSCASVPAPLDARSLQARRSHHTRSHTQVGSAHSLARTNRLLGLVASRCRLLPVCDSLSRWLLARRATPLVMATAPTDSALQPYDLPTTEFFAATPKINIAYARVKATKKDVPRNPVLLIGRTRDSDSRQISRSGDSTSQSTHPGFLLRLCLSFPLSWLHRREGRLACTAVSSVACGPRRRGVRPP